MSKLLLKEAIVFITILFMLPLIMTLPNDALAQNSNDVVANKIEKALSVSKIPQEDLGIFILKNEEPIFKKNDNKKFIPASLSKILTAIAVLKLKSPEERLKTELLSSGKVKGDQLLGAICLKGSGDPSFLSEQMWGLVNNFSRLGIKDIKGPIYIDDFLFDQNYFDSSRKSQRVSRAYDSPVSGLSFNWNTANVYLAPTLLGEPLRVSVDPADRYFTIVNKTKTVKGSKDNQVEVQRKSNGSQEELIIQGTLGIGHPEIVKYVGISDPIMWVKENLIQFLKQRGISISDSSASRKKCESSATTLSEIQGWTYLEMVMGMLKFSNNFLAEVLTKKLASDADSKPGSIEKGIEIIKSALDKYYGLKKNSYDFRSPSGFSNENKITPRGLGELLHSASQDFEVSSFLLSSLAIPQSEGTLSKRMGELKRPRVVRAKTGLLSGAVGLAGYLHGLKGEAITYVFIYNGKGKETQSKDLFDKIVMELSR